MAKVIEAKTPLRVERRFNFGGTMICHGALVNGEIDLYAEYTGTGLTAILKEPVISDPEKALHHVRKAYLERFRAQWLQPFGFNNTYAITVRKDDAVQRQWHTISDLENTASQLRAGFTAEFAERPDGYPRLEQGLRPRVSGNKGPGSCYYVPGDCKPGGRCDLRFCHRWPYRHVRPDAPPRRPRVFSPLSGGPGGKAAMSHGPS